MNEKKRIDFDVLENSDMDTIEKIGADTMKIDKKARDRMMKNTFKKYEQEKKQLDAERSFGASAEDEDYVSGVEQYKSRKISRFVYAALCTAAAVALTAGGIYMVRNDAFSGKKADVPATEITTSVTAAVNTTEAAATTETSAKTTAKTTTETTTTATESTTTEPVTAAAADSMSHTNLHTDRTDITDEELDAARIRALDDVMNNGMKIMYEGKVNISHMQLTDIKYSMTDVNGDSVPELFVSTEIPSTHLTYMFIYDGTDYSAAEVTLHLWSGEVSEGFAVANAIEYCPEENLICLMSKEGYEYLQIMEFDKDYTITTKVEYNYTGYYENGELLIEENGQGDGTGINNFNEECSRHNWLTIEYTDYADNNFDSFAPGEIN